MPNKAKKDSIIIHNIKSSSYRQVHIDGAHGAVTPSGHININFFSQRGAIPKGTEFALNHNGEITEAIRDIEGSKNGIVREFEFGTYMDINTCMSIKSFLEKKIEEYHSLIKNS